MNNELVQITLPLTQEGLLGAALLLVLFGVVALALFGDGLKSNDEPMVRALKAFAWVYGIVWLFVFLGTLQTLWFVFTGTGPEGHGDDIRSLGMGALIAALLGAPFVIWGTVLKHQTVMFQKEGHMTDRINKAVEQLGAVKDMEWIGRPVKILKGQVKENTQFISDNSKPSLKSNQRIKSSRRVIQEYWDEKADDVHEIDGIEYTISTWLEEVTEIEVRGVEMLLEDTDLVSSFGEWQVFKKTEPNLEVRIGAILSLERISEDSNRHDKGRDYLRVMEILCAYIRENSKKGEESNRHYPTTRKDAFKYIYGLPVPRIDIQLGLQVIGRQKCKRKFFTDKSCAKGDFFEFDLSGCDFRRISLMGLDFSELDFRDSWFDGAIIRDCNFSESNLLDSSFICASLVDSLLLKANLGADFSYSVLNGSDFEFYETDSLDFKFRSYNGRFASFVGAQMLDANFYFTGHSFNSHTFVSRAKFSEAIMRGCLFNGFNNQYEHDWPDLFHAGTKGEKGLAFRNCALSADVQRRCMLDLCFGDGTVRLSDGSGPNSPTWPAHWPKECLSDEEFSLRLEEWRAARN